MAEYKIKDLETLTGIKAHTIRIWEKRYNFLSPERTDTQIRTYTDEELTLLLNIAILNKNGIKISKIADLSPQQIAQKVWEIRGKHTVDNSTELLILSLIELDEQLFNTTLQKIINERGMTGAFINYLIPFLDRIGVMWLVGSISTAQEHFISNLIRQKIISETDKLDIPKSFENPVMLFLPEHEWHEISLLFYHFILRSKGLPTIYLGQSLPYESMLECVEKLKPRVLVTSWLTAIDERFILNYFANLLKDTKDLPIYAGGFQIETFSAKLPKEINRISDITVLDQVLKAI